MPFITVRLLEGKTPEQKRALVQKFTEAVTDVLGVEASKTFVFFDDMSKDNYGKNGDLVSFAENEQSKQ